MAATDAWPELLAEMDRREQTIKALVLEGAWAETDEEREALLKRAGYVVEDE